MQADSNRLFVIDFAVIVFVSVLISLAADKLLFMTIAVPLIIVARTAVLAALGKAERINIKAEIIFLLICTAFGAFNDWNSVCHKKIYDYTVPHYFEFSTIPLWMLLFWGMILRFIARFARWQTLDPPTEISDRVRVGTIKIDNPVVKVIAQLVLIFATRAMIYRYYLDPVLSWAPFAAGLVVYLALFKTTLHDYKLLAIFLIGGPLIEVLYIQVGELHRYHLGWLWGVPLWIALWWLVIILIWKDFAFRIEKTLREKLG